MSQEILSVLEYMEKEKGIPREDMISAIANAIRSGKPPFKRTREEVPVIDVAVMDVEPVTGEADFRGRPPFKRHR